MGVIRTILMVVFVIVCILLVLLVMIQNDNDSGMGGVFGGGQSAAFGAHSANVLTKTTGVLVALFFILAFTLGLLNKANTNKADLSAAAAQVQGVEESAESASETGNWWEDSAE